MALVKINWSPTAKDLHNFGSIAAIALLLIAAVLYVWKDLPLSWCATIAGIGFFIFLCSMLSLKLARLIYLVLTLFTFPIGVVMSFVLLALFYYLLLTPVGLVFRLIGRDPLNRKFDASASTYWRQRRAAEGMKRYFNQF